MHKKVSILKFLKILLVFLTLSSFVVSCNGSMQPEPEPGPNTEIDDEGEKESGKESGNENGNESGNESSNEDEGESEEQSGNDAGTVTESIAVPEGLAITQGDKTNFVKVTWTANDSPYYWIFYSTTENTEDSILVTKKADQATAEEGYQFALPPEASGTCYFWIKAADGYEETSKTSAFSEAISYRFRYTTLYNPTNFSVSEGSTPEEVKLVWSDNSAAYYWIFYSQVNNTEEAECITRAATASDANGYLFTLKKPGTYYFWIKAADGKKETSPSSNFSSCKSYRLSTTDLIAPDKIFIEPDSSIANVVNLSIIETGAPYYWIYQNDSDDSSTAKCVNRYFHYYTTEYSVSLYSSGTYYFWVKAADGSSDSSSTSGFSKVASYEFTHQDLTPPTGLTVTASEKTNTVKVTWTPNEANYCWIYYNTKNDPNTATCASRSYRSSLGNSGCEIKLSKNGTNYFWVKSADSSSSDSYTSDFSEVVTYDFTNSITAPTGLAVQEGSETNTVLLTWTPNDSEYYWIYYNDKNETETAKCKTKSATSSKASGYKILLPNSGTYYFWIVGANNTDDYSYTEKSSYSEPATYEFNNSLSVPTGLAVQASTTLNSVSVTWVPNGSAYYWLYYNSTNDVSTSKKIEIYSSSSNEASSQKITLPSSGTYYFWIKSAESSSYDSASSDYSSVVSFNFAYNDLTPPTGLSVKLGSSKNKAKVTWNDNNSAYYRIYYNTENNPETATCADKYTTSYYATSGYIITLPSTGLYYFWIKSADGYYDDSATSGFSEAVSFEFPDKMPAPTGLRVVAGSTVKSVKLYWDEDSSSYYWIYYNTENNPETATCASQSFLHYYVTDGYSLNLPSCGTYYFWVKGANGSTNTAETSDFSSVISYEVKIDVPTGLRTQAGTTPDLVNLFWNKSNASCYWVYHNTEDNPATATCLTQNAPYSGYGYQITLTTKGTNYFWVKGATGSSDSAETSDFSASISYDLIVEAPTDLRVQAGNYYNSMKLYWTHNGSKNYWIYYNTENNFETATKTTSTASSDTATSGYELKNLKKSGTYYFWIQGATSYSNSAITSDPSTVVTYDLVFPVPTDLSLSPNSTNSNVITLSWESTGSSYYWIYYNTQDDTSTATCVTKKVYSDYTYTINLPQSGTYYFWVRKGTGYSDTDDASNFSESVSYTYINQMPVPTNVTVSEGTTYTNSVIVKWKYSTPSDTYWIYYSTTDNPLDAVCATNLASTNRAETGESVILPASGTYYFWVRSAQGLFDNYDSSDFSASASYNFTYTQLTPPTDLRVVTDSSSSNTVKVYWTGNKSMAYWIYYSTNNDPTTAKRATVYGNSYSSTHGYSITLPSSATYYFWIKSADGYDDDDGTSDFSKPFVY